MYEAIFGRVSTRDLRPSQLIFSAELGPGRSKMQLQSFYSFILRRDRHRDHSAGHVAGRAARETDVSRASSLSPAPRRIERLGVHTL